MRILRKSRLLLTPRGAVLALGLMEDMKDPSFRLEGSEAVTSASAVRTADATSSADAAFAAASAANSDGSSLAAVAPPPRRELEADNSEDSEADLRNLGDLGDLGEKEVEVAADFGVSAFGVSARLESWLES